MPIPAPLHQKYTEGLWRFPLVFILALIALSFTPHVQANSVLRISFWSAAGILLAWQAVLFGSARRRRLSMDVVFRKQHYIQAAIHFTIYAYWGWYWSQVYSEAGLIAGQLLFAYAFDMLLSWSRRGHWTLGFGPFPIIFSTNLFIWFRDDWFYLQFLMIAVGFLGKEFIRWNRDGRQVHIFNPSAFSLGIFSIGLILTGQTAITWGEEIATTLYYPPYIYYVLFGLGLIVMYHFSVTLVAASAAVTLFGLSALYRSATGVYYFFDSEIPIAVFLGLHFLVTDPSTSPRTPLGRTLFGVLYGVGVFALYTLLGWFGAPTFYDKLLAVPFMNLAVRVIDRFVSFDSLRLPRLSWTPARLNMAHMAVWIAFFGVMAGRGAVADTHEGHQVPFWQNACSQNLRSGCRNLILMESVYCQQGSGWACNELGIHLMDGTATTREPARARRVLARACDLGFEPGCRNLEAVSSGWTPPRHADPAPTDYTFLLREGRGPLPEMTALELYERACDQGWAAGCRDRALVHVQSPAPEFGQAAPWLERACEAGDASSCSNLGLMYRQGDGVAEDRNEAVALLRRACDLGLPQACHWLAEESGTEPSPAER